VEPGGTRWVDSHCHVYGDEELAAFSRAATDGIDACVVIGTDAESSVRAVEVANAEVEAGTVWPTRFATIGLHPHEASAGVAPIAELVASHVTPVGDGRAAGSVVAVGECGLDYFYEHSPRDAQRRAFAEQIVLAREHDLTLVVHTRDAWEDTFAILDDLGMPQRTVIHCFTGGPEQAEECLARGAYLSFSGIVTFKTATELREAAVACPGDRMLVETDAPYLAPVPHRGRPNEPAFVAVVGAFLAQLRGEDPAELAASTRSNTARAFAARW
jgi:TatD DNase family protein